MPILATIYECDKCGNKNNDRHVPFKIIGTEIVCLEYCSTLEVK